MSKIEVGGYIFDTIFGTDYGHTFLRYTNDAGDRYVIRGGWRPEETGFSINFEINTEWADSVDNPENSIHGTLDQVFRTVDPKGRDVDLLWELIVEAVESIQEADASYLFFWNNCQAVVRSALNAVGIDAAPLQNAIEADTGGSYPNTGGVIDERYQLGEPLIGKMSDDILRGAADSDIFLGSEGNDEIHGNSLDGEGIRDHDDQISYQLVQGSVILNLSLDPSHEVEALVKKDSGWDTLFAIEKYFLTTNDDTLIVSSGSNTTQNIPVRHVDLLQGMDVVDVSTVAEDFRIDLSKLEDQSIERKNSGLAPIKFANAQLAKTGVGDDIVLGPDFKNYVKRADPLVLDLNGGDLDLTGLTLASPRFDIDGDGYFERTGWVAAGSALLARDVNSDGLITNVNELFGTNTESGFALLADLDDVANGGNADGIIDVNDASFADLRLWLDGSVDGNINAFTNPGELVTLDSLGITEFDLTTSEPADGEDNVSGNTVTAVSSFTRSDGSTGTLADVSFVYETAGKSDTDGDGVPDDDDTAEDPDGKNDGFAFDGLTFFGGVDGGGGDDTIEPGAVDTLVVGGDGKDTVDYSTRTYQGGLGLTFTATLGAGGTTPIGESTGTATTVAPFRFEVEKQVEGADAATDALYQVEVIKATELDDTVIIKTIKDIPSGPLAFDAGDQKTDRGDELDFSQLDEGVEFEYGAIKGYDGSDFTDFETIKGTSHNDTLLIDRSQAGEPSVTVVGGEGRDWIWNRSAGGELYGDTFSGVSATPDEDGNPVAVDYDDPANADNFWWWPDTTIKDAQRNDVLQFFGLPLTGGVQGLPLIAGGGAAALFTPSAGLFSDDAFNNEQGHFFVDNFLVSMNYVFKKDADGNNTLYVVNALDGLMGLFSDVSFEQTSDGSNIRGAMTPANDNGLPAQEVAA